MALVKCKECGHEISKKADKCPNCGAPQKRQGMSPGSSILLILVILGAIGFIVGKDPPSGNPSPSRSNSPSPSSSNSPSYDRGPTVSDFEIVDWNWRADPNFTSDGSVIWNVEVRNNSSQYVEYLKVEFSTYSSNGRLIDTDYTHVQGLSPGGTGTAKGYATYYGSEKNAKIQIRP